MTTKRSPALRKTLTEYQRRLNQVIELDVEAEATLTEIEARASREATRREVQAAGGMR